MAVVKFGERTWAVLITLNQLEEPIMSTKQQIYQKEFAQMSVEDRQWVICNTETAIALFAKAVENRAKEDKEASLEHIGFFETPAIKKFVVAEKFRESKTTDGVRITFVNENFKKYFLPKVEENVYAAWLRNHRLCRNSVDTPIITEIGGEAKAEIYLAQMWELLKRQGSGEPSSKGGLLVNNEGNISYSKGVNGVLWVLSANWSNLFNGWGVEAHAIPIPGEWSTGFQVISH